MIRDVSSSASLRRSSISGNHGFYQFHVGWVDETDATVPQPRPQLGDVVAPEEIRDVVPDVDWRRTLEEVIDNLQPSFWYIRPIRSTNHS